MRLSKKSDEGREKQKLAIATATAVALVIPLGFATPSIAIERAEYNVQNTKARKTQVGTTGRFPDYTIDYLSEIDKIGNKNGWKAVWDAYGRNISQTLKIYNSSTDANTTGNYKPTYTNYTGILNDGSYDLFGYIESGDAFAKYIGNMPNGASRYPVKNFNEYLKGTLGGFYIYPYQSTWLSVNNYNPNSANILQDIQSNIPGNAAEKNARIKVWEASPLYSSLGNNGEILNLKNEAEQQKIKLDQLVKNNSTLNKINELNNQINALNESNKTSLNQKIQEYNTLSANAKNAEQSMKALENQLSGQQGSTNQDITNIQNKLDTAKQEMQSKSDAADAIESKYNQQLSEYNQSKNDYETKLNGIKAEIGQLQDQINALPKDSDQGYSQASASEEKLKGQVDALKQQYNSVNNEYQSVLAEHNSLQQQVDTIKAEYNNAKTNVQNIQTDLDALKQKIESNNSQLLDEYNKAKSAYDEAVSAKNAAETELNQQKQDVAKKNAEYKAEYDSIINNLDPKLAQEIKSYNSNNDKLKQLFLLEHLVQCYL